MMSNYFVKVTMTCFRTNTLICISSTSVLLFYNLLSLSQTIVAKMREKFLSPFLALNFGTQNFPFTPFTTLNQNGRHSWLRKSRPAMR